MTDLRDSPHAENIDHGVVVYSGARLTSLGADPVTRRALQAELAHDLLDGPGVVAVRGAFSDLAVVDHVSTAFRQMIQDQHTAGRQVGDHFAAPGANDRVWNALEKLAIGDPEAFAAYYANDVIALVAWAWLGPGYQVTSQVNVVNPGGAAQAGHCDYHLGFQSTDVAEQFPAHVHRLSPTLTLQGAVAHVDMPIESGPTKYLPHSQKYPLGYLAWPRPEFSEYFEAHHIQLDLAKGDAVFFNPAVFHAAGHNRSADCRRMANLLQISSAFGRAMEHVDRDAMCIALYPTMLRWRGDARSDQAIGNVISASAEGYPFPTNLDRDPPVDGLAPPSQAALMRRAVHDGWDLDRFRDALASQTARRTGAVP